MTTTRLIASVLMRVASSVRGKRLGFVATPFVLGSAGILGLSSLLGCNELTGSQPLPAGTSNPSSYNTPAGALGMRNQVIIALEQELPKYIIDTGLLTDELESNLVGQGSGVRSLPSGGALDERILPALQYGAVGTAADGDYSNLQAIRGAVSQAVNALAVYDTVAPPAIRGELYALEGYTEILLADFFCSGVPLSTLDFQKDYTYHAGSTTAQVYQDAIVKLDSAYTLASASDSVRIQNLARVLKGRALLDLGRYDSAAATVAAVPDGFQYQLAVRWVDSTFSDNVFNAQATISNNEGGRGLPFLSNGDPRTADTVVHDVNTEFGNVVALTFPNKYVAGLSSSGFAPFTVADGIEAKLIQAEAALQTNPSGQTWLEILNTLRATAPIPGTTQPAMVQQLPPLSDPGNSPGNNTRLSLLFQERAYWLFLTGHRQGDLRRLIRQYGRRQDQVYPVGGYKAPGTGQYGTDVTASIAGAEYANPLFQGCLNRGA